MRALPALPPGVRAVAVVAATSLFMVLVAWATLIGPDEFFAGPGPRPATVTTTPPSCTDAPTPSEDATRGVVFVPAAETTTPCPEPDTSQQDATDMASQADPPLWLKMLVWVFQIVVLVAVLGVLAWLASLALRALANRSRRATERTEIAFATLSAPVRVEEQIVADAEEQDALLLDGEPRNAIVAAWHRFEVQGERAGVERRPSETSSEYAIRVLDLVRADSGWVNRLAELYREARFSEHPITEEHRAAALEALAGIRQGLGVRS